MAEKRATTNSRTLDFMPSRREKQSEEDRVPISSYVLRSELRAIEAARKIERKSRSSFIADAVLDHAFQVIRSFNRSNPPQLPPEK